jgi:hypothetical protein
MTVRKIRAGRVPTADINTYVGDIGTLFYSETTGELRISNDTLPGGLSTTGNIRFVDGNIILPPGGGIIDSNGSSVLGNISGNINVISTPADRLTSGNANLVLIGGNDPFVTFPAVSTGESISIQGGEIASLSGTAAVTSSNSVVINTGALSVLKTWTFGDDGNLTFPDGTIQSTAFATNVTFANTTIGNVQFTNGSFLTPNRLFLNDRTSLDIGFTSLQGSPAIVNETVSITLDGMSVAGNAAGFSFRNNSRFWFDADNAYALGQSINFSGATSYVKFGTTTRDETGGASDIELFAFGGDDSHGNVYISAGGYPTNRRWTFNSFGNVIFPDGTVQSTAYTGQGGGNPFDQDVNTTDSPNFVNLGLAGTAGAGYATLSIANNRNFVIGLNDTTTGAQTFEFTRNGVVLVPGTIESQNMLEIIGDTVRLWGEGQFSNASLNLPNNNDSNSMPTALVNLGNAGVSIGAGITQYKWNFGSDGNLTLPTGVIGPSTTDKGLVISGPLTADMVPVDPQNPSSYNTISNGVNIRTHRIGDNLTRDWTFSWDGTLYPPHDTVASQVGAIEWRVPDLNIANQIRPTRGSGTEPAGLKLFTYGPNVAITLEAGLGVDAKWHFKDDSSLTIPGDIVGYQTYINSNPLDERVTIQPSGSVDKPFKFITDQNAGTWLRSMMELPVAEVNKAVTLGFPHSDNKVGYIYTQGTDSSGTEFNNAFNIMANGTDVKIGVVSGGGNKIWKFDANGAVTFPDSTVQSTAFTGTAATVDILATNGLTTTMYPTFVDATSGDVVVRADQDLTYRTDNNLLTVGNIKTNVLKIEDGVHEALTIRAGDGGGFTSDFDCSTGYISYCTSVSGNWTANFTNLTLAEGYATVLTIVIEQTGTPGYPSAVQIEGSSKTILWQGNTLPTPSTTGTDVVTFSILRTGISGNEYVVLGQMTGF